MWKVVSTIIKERCNETITFEDSLHGFRSERGTSTAIIEAKLRMETRIAEGKTMFQVFLDLSKAYDTVDRGKLLYLLRAYGLGTNLSLILENFWNQLWVVPKQKGYYGKPIKSDRGVTQGDPLSPTLFNVIVDAVVRETKRILSLTDNDAIFYADDGLITGTNRDAVQYCIDLVTHLFSLFGLQMNASKTKALVGRPRIVTHSISTPAFNRRQSGEGHTYASISRQLTTCTICGLQLQQRSLQRHMINQHQNYARPITRTQITARFTNQPITYTISLNNNNLTATPCPVPNCPGSYSSRSSMRTHFQHRHWNDVIHILEEGPFPLPQCPRCLLFTSNAQTARHQQSKTCAAGYARKIRRLQQLANEAGETTTLYVNGTAIENVDSFRYLGRILTATDDDQLAIVHNLQKAKRSWRRIQTILRRQGATPHTSGNFYKAVVQSTLLYGSDTWNITDRQLDILNGFHNNVTRIISNNPIRKINDSWIYPNLGHAQRITGIEPINTYVQARKLTLLQWAQTRPIYHLARTIENNSNSNVSLWGPAPTPLITANNDPIQDNMESPTQRPIQTPPTGGID
jgi:Reverse transcriptase (RNA-dependent DNA polymerase)